MITVIPARLQPVEEWEIGSLTEGKRFLPRAEIEEKSAHVHRMSHIFHASRSMTAMSTNPYTSVFSCHALHFQSGYAYIYIYVGSMLLGHVYTYIYKWRHPLMSQYFMARKSIMEDCYLYCSILFSYLLQLWHNGGGGMLILYKKLPDKFYLDFYCYNVILLKHVLNQLH